MFIYRAAVGGIAALMKVIPYSGKCSERNSSEISEMLYTFRKFISEKLLWFCWQRATIVIQSIDSNE